METTPTKPIGSMTKMRLADLLNEWMGDNCYPLHPDGMLGEDETGAVDSLIEMLRENGYTLALTA